MTGGICQQKKGAVLGKMKGKQSLVLIAISVSHITIGQHTQVKFSLIQSEVRIEVCQNFVSYEPCRLKWLVNTMLFCSLLPKVLNVRLQKILNQHVRNTGAISDTEDHKGKQTGVGKPWFL